MTAHGMHELFKKKRETLLNSRVNSKNLQNVRQYGSKIHFVFAGLNCAARWKAAVWTKNGKREIHAKKSIARARKIRGLLTLGESRWRDR